MYCDMYYNYIIVKLWLSDIPREWVVCGGCAYQTVQGLVSTPFMFNEML